ncbi:hypothetical protein [Colwellia sp. BRX10-4]|jgi:hypothetical protein|uniref:hypothetical protein n=1 Tax=Colwellia sp. BRX10-4 TaxID=2759843 RepID=UPI0015F4ABB2|nr:hypothetical protein [Colwellia sp. BRX10-4]MBA6396976.1 hypothetical protein [Colwellia sp. BRX10-4]
MNVNYLFLLLLIFLSTFSQASTKIEVFTTSQSFSNILPVKQLTTGNNHQKKMLVTVLHQMKWVRAVIGNTCR